MIPVTKPYVPNSKSLFNRIEAIHRNNWFTNSGPFFEELTHKLESFLGVNNLLLLSNGTLALQIAYKALGIRKKMISTPFSFIASSSAAKWEGIDLIYSDIDSDTLNLNPNLLEKVESRVDAVQAVHVFGNPADVVGLKKIADSKNAKLVIDGAHAFAVKRNNRSVLLDADATTLSFHSTKVFHTVEGGAIVFKHQSDYEVAKSLINFGFDEAKNIERIGINCKLNEYQAAVGLTVLEDIDKILDSRLSLFYRYRSLLNDVIQMPKFDTASQLNGSYMPVIFDSEESLKFSTQYLADNGIQTRRYFYPSLNEVPAVSGYGDCPNSESVSRRILCLPLFTQMTLKEVDYVVSILAKSLVPRNSLV